MLAATWIPAATASATATATSTALLGILAIGCSAKKDDSAPAPPPAAETVAPAQSAAMGAPSAAGAAAAASSPNSSGGASGSANGAPIASPIASPVASATPSAAFPATRPGVGGQMPIVAGAMLSSTPENQAQADAQTLIAQVNADISQQKWPDADAALARLDTLRDSLPGSIKDQIDALHTQVDTNRNPAPPQ
jgi:hypothetical protein